MPAAEDVGDHGLECGQIGAIEMLPDVGMDDGIRGIGERHGGDGGGKWKVDVMCMCM